MSNHTKLRVAALALAGVLAGCASGGGSTPAPGGGSTTVTAPDIPWPIKTREHIDLWLHGFGMLHNDTTLVPYFKRGYKDRMTVLKNSANVTTNLDANRDRLYARFAINPHLVNAQFVPLHFESMQAMSQAIGLFVQYEGDPRAATNQQQAQGVAVLGGYFQSAADREWLRLFWASLQDESSKFYHNYWTQEQRTRADVLTAVDSLWKVYRPAMQAYLNNTQQTNGNIYLSMPLNGEGRTLTPGKTTNSVAVTFPETRASAIDAIYVITHEVMAAAAGTAVNDNVTPTDRRTGVVDRYVANAAVRGGLLLLQKVAPPLADGYARYYLRAANRSPGSNPQTQLATVFPLPDAIRDDLTRQLNVVLGGI